MKRLPSPLLGLLQTPQAITFKADLYYFQLANGLTFGATSGQLDIKVATLTFNGNTLASNVLFYAKQYGNWSRGTISTKVGLQSGSTSVTVSANPTTNAPGGSLPIMQAIQARLFRGAKLWIFTAYGTSYGDVSAGLELKFVGILGEISNAGRLTAEFKVNDLLYLLNLQMPRNLIQSNCRHTFGDSVCTISLAAITQANTIAAFSTPLVINFGTASSSTRLAQGRIVWTGGLNSGLQSSIRSQVSSTQVVLTVPTVFPPSTGDTFNLIPGCDHTLATCHFYQGSNALLNFGGQPFVPSPETVL